VTVDFLSFRSRTRAHAGTCVGPRPVATVVRPDHQGRGARLHRVIAMSTGSVPTVIGVPAVLVAVGIAVTVA